LYHYTSIESLALILHNGTILFNSLQKVDDLEEVECNDVKDYGKYCYVSCWTDVEEESIPLWKMYTPDMKGVRIKLPLYPFKKYKFDEIVLPFKYNNVFPSFPIETYINYETLEKERRAFIFPNEPKLVQIEYTEDKNLLYQNVLEKIANENGNEATYNITLRNDKIGKYKMERWALWQKDAILSIGISHTEPTAQIPDSMSLASRTLLLSLPIVSLSGFVGGVPSLFTKVRKQGLTLNNTPVKPEPEAPPLVVKTVTVCPMYLNNSSSVISIPPFLFCLNSIELQSEA
jgi:hypothetical protein